MSAELDPSSVHPALGRLLLSPICSIAGSQSEGFAKGLKEFMTGLSRRRSWKNHQLRGWAARLYRNSARCVVNAGSQTWAIFFEERFLSERVSPIQQFSPPPQLVRALMIFH